MKRTPLNKVSKKKKARAKEEYEFRCKVRERDVFCVVCGEQAQSVHHIKNRSYPSLWTDPENGLYMCELKCHADFEANPEYADAWVQEYRPQQWGYVTKHIRDRYNTKIRGA